MFEEPEDPASKSFFSEIIASISDVKFTPNGKFFVTRDYLQLKVWDLAMESRPVLTIDVHEHLRPKLCDLYENDCIFDKFECSVASSSGSFVTGSCVIPVLCGSVSHRSQRIIAACRSAAPCPLLLPLWRVPPCVVHVCTPFR